MLADFRVEQGQLDKGLEAYSKAIQLLTTTFVQSRHATLKTALCRSHEHRAETPGQLSRHDESLGDWDKVLELCDPDMAFVHRTQRADSLLRSGKVEQALAEVEKLAQVDTKKSYALVSFCEALCDCKRKPTSSQGRTCCSSNRVAEKSDRPWVQRFHRNERRFRLSAATFWR